MRADAGPDQTKITRPTVGHGARRVAFPLLNFTMEPTADHHAYGRHRLRAVRGKAVPAARGKAAARWPPVCRQPDGAAAPAFGRVGVYPAHRESSRPPHRRADRIAARVDRRRQAGGAQDNPTVAVLYHASPASFIPREGIGRLRAITGLGLRSAPVPRRSELTDLVSSTPASPTATS